MIQLSFDTDAVIRRIDAALEKIDGLHEAMPAELTAWQTDDMNRSRPNTEVPHRDTAATSIWPTSRRYLVRRRRPRRRRLVKPSGGVITAHTRRPILQPALFDRLRERMNDLLGTVTWR